MLKYFGLAFPLPTTLHPHDFYNIRLCFEVPNHFISVLIGWDNNTALDVSIRTDSGREPCTMPEVQ